MRYNIYKVAYTKTLVSAHKTKLEAVLALQKYAKNSVGTTICSPLWYYGNATANMLFSHRLNAPTTV